MNCEDCLNFKPFSWTNEKGFCNFRKATNGQVIVGAKETCEHFDGGKK